MGDLEQLHGHKRVCDSDARAHLTQYRSAFKALVHEHGPSLPIDILQLLTLPTPDSQRAELLALARDAAPITLLRAPLPPLVANIAPQATLAQIKLLIRKAYERDNTGTVSWKYIWQRFELVVVRDGRTRLCEGRVQFGDVLRFEPREKRDKVPRRRGRQRQWWVANIRRADRWRVRKRA